MEKKKESDKAHVLAIKESDEDWERDLQAAEEEGIDLAAELREWLDEVRPRLLQALPEKFHPYVHNHTFNTQYLPKTVREQYLAWVDSVELTFREVLQCAHENTQQALPYLSQTAHDVFSDSLHDAQIQMLERDDEMVTVMLNTSGGFTSKAIVILKFIGIQQEVGKLEKGSYYIYDELQKTADGFALRVIWDCPELEWTIHCKSIEAAYYFRPLAYHDATEQKDWQSFYKLLNRSYQHFFISDVVIPWDFTMPEERTDGVYIDNIKIANSLQECIALVYCDTYEDPYAIFSVPVPAEELEQAILSDDLEWKTRAFNTLYADPSAHREVINRILQIIDIQEENEMMISIMVQHFMKNGILDEETKERFNV
ncbi:MAG: DUF4085 family protein [Lysinibacillus sp.]